MKIEKKYSKFAVKYTYDKMIEVGVELDKEMLDSFKSVLEDRAARKKYAEGQRLAPEDVELLKNNIRVLINGAIKKHDKASDSVKERTSPHKYIMWSYYYLTALAMDTLNCPELPAKMGKDIIAQATQRLIDTKPPRKSAQEYFNKQRRKDFLDISDGIISLIEKIDENAKDHKSLAELYGQYRALSERQANHTGIWRFFHREENKNRNELLELMASRLKQHFPGGEIDLTKEPSEVYHNSMYNDYMKRINELLDLTELTPESAYGYYDYKYNLKLFPEDQKKDPKQKDKDKENSVQDEKDKENSVQENSVQDQNENVQEESVQEQNAPDMDQVELIGRLTDDLAEDSSERLSKIDPPETGARSMTIN